MANPCPTGTCTPQDAPSFARRDNADLAVALGLPVVVVAANRSGCINHSRLTVEAVRNRGLEAKAVVVNAPDAGGTDGDTYRDDLAAVLDIPVIACRHGKMDWEASTELARLVRPGGG